VPHRRPVVVAVVALLLSSVAAAAAQPRPAFVAGDTIEFQPFGDGSAWTRGRVVEVLGTYGGCTSYRVAYAAADQAWRGTATPACQRVRAIGPTGAAGAASAGAIASEQATVGRGAAPPLGTYRCAAGVMRAGVMTTEARSEFRLVSPTTYAIGSASHPYAFDASAGTIRWRGGPFASPYPESRFDAKAGWIGIARAGERWDCRLR
jgi:hypothetical protein